MLDQFLAVAYEKEVTKTAERAVIDKLKTLPVERLYKMANDTKLAFLGNEVCGAKSGIGDPKTWLDMFKDSPLFDQALELERTDLQLEKQEVERRMAEQTNDVWIKRDALRLQKRMLELDLALQQDGGGAEPEAKEEQGVELLEQAQAEERSAGEGEEPHEQKEDAAIQQFQKAQSEEAAAKAKKPPAPAPPPAQAAPEQPAAKTTEVKVAGYNPDDHMNIGAPEGSIAIQPHASGDFILSGTVAGKAHRGQVPRAEVLKNHPDMASLHDEVYGKGKWGTKTAEATAETKVATAVTVGKLMAKIAKDSEDKPKKGRLLRAISGAGAGALGGGAGVAAVHAAHRGMGLLQGRGRSEGFANPKKVIGTAAALGAAYGGMRGAFGKEKEKTADENPEGHRLRRALLGNPISTAIEAKPGHKLEGFGSAAKHYAGQTLKGIGIGGAAGAGLGALSGVLSKGAIKPGQGAMVGGLLGANVGSQIGGFKGHQDADASRIHGEHSKHKEASISVAEIRASVKEAGFIGSALTAGKAALPQIGAAAKGAGNMLGAAYKSGGLGQVAKSVGTAATGFAKANPLAAAGAAAGLVGGAGIMAGRLSKSNQPQA